MTNNDFSFTEVVQNLLNILGVLSILSVLLFFIGLVNYYAYYVVLGVDTKFLDFEYYQYIFNGIVRSPLLVFMVVFCTVIYFTNFYEFYRLRIDFFDLKKDILKSDNDDLKNKIVQEESKINFLLDLQNQAVKRMFGLFNKIFIPSLVIIGFIVLICYKIHYYGLVFNLLPFALNLGIIFLFSYHLKRFVQTRDALYEFLFVFLPTVFFVLTVLPLLTGYFEAKQKIKTDDFVTYSVFTQGKEISDNAKFVYYGKDKYFFYINNLLEVIPESEVSLLIKK